MTSTRSSEITGLLTAWREGDPAALDRLSTFVYDDLLRLAHRHMNERPGNTLQTTALVNEVYLRLVDVKSAGSKDRAQFFALSPQMLRRILVDPARARAASKRGAGAVEVDVDKVHVLSPEPDGSLVALDDALEALAQIS